jgi:hypothetical protein
MVPNGHAVSLFIGKSEPEIEVIRGIYLCPRFGRLLRDITRALNLVITWKTREHLKKQLFLAEPSEIGHR